MRLHLVCWRFLACGPSTACHSAASLEKWTTLGLYWAHVLQTLYYRFCKLCRSHVGCMMHLSWGRAGQSLGEHLHTCRASILAQQTRCIASTHAVISEYMAIDKHTTFLLRYHSKKAELIPAAIYGWRNSSPAFEEAILYGPSQPSICRWNGSLSQYSNSSINVKHSKNTSGRLFTISTLHLQRPQPVTLCAGFIQGTGSGNQSTFNARNRRQHRQPCLTHHSACRILQALQLILPSNSCLVLGFIQSCVARSLGRPSR